MTYMFTGDNVFDQDISAWNVKNVQTMVGMFYNTASFSHSPNAWKPEFIVSSRDCERLADMFYNAPQISCTDIRDMLISWGLKSAFGIPTCDIKKLKSTCE